jgi:predicted dienelactone hydrolase
VIGVRTFSYLDSSRLTYNYVTGTSTKGRRIEIELRYPGTSSTAPSGQIDPGARVAKRRAYPLVVFAPGYRLQPSDYASLLDAWVHKGYFVASVDFPNTTYPGSEAAYTAGLPHGLPETDLYLEPGDLAFAIASFERTASTRGSWLDGLIDRSQLVLAGHSDGGSAVAAAVYDAPYAHPELGVRGVVVLSGAEFPIANQKYGQLATPVPLLVVQSAADRCQPPSDAVQLYDAIGTPKYFVELSSASHLGAVDGTDAGATAAVEAVTSAFFAEVFDQGNQSASGIVTAGTVSGIASTSTTATVSPIPSPSGPTVCPVN